MNDKKNNSILSFEHELADRETELALLKETSEALSIEFNVSRLLQVIAERAKSLIHARTVLIPVLNRDCTEYTYKAGSGENANEIIGETLPIEFGICGWVWENRQAWWQSTLDELSDEEKTKWEGHAQNVILVPLIGKKHFLGGIAGMNKENGEDFSKRDLDLLSLFANQAAIAVENAMLYEELQELNISLERRVEQRTEELQQINNEMESFSYSVSHDLRAPLRSIIGFSEALTEDISEQLDEVSRDYLQRINNSAHNMNTLIDALLKLAKLRRSVLHKDEVNLSALAQQVNDEIHEQQPQIHFEIDIEPDLIVMGDKAMLHIVLYNLFINAIKFTRDNVTPKIVFGLDKDSGGAVYFVRDNGVGFDSHYADKLFVAFQRLHREEDFEGTGIGLATVARIIHRHGGNIWATSAPNRGATFYFSL